MTDCAGCPDPGMCCRYVELPVRWAIYDGNHRRLDLHRGLTPDEARWVGLHPGFFVQPDGYEVAGPSVHGDWNEAATAMHWDIPCSALGADGSCALYGKPERPLMCGDWPTGPHQAPEGCNFNSANNWEPLRLYEKVT